MLLQDLWGTRHQHHSLTDTMQPAFISLYLNSTDSGWFEQQSSVQKQMDFVELGCFFFLFFFFFTCCIWNRQILFKRFKLRLQQMLYNNADMRNADTQQERQWISEAGVCLMCCQTKSECKCVLSCSEQPSSKVVGKPSVAEKVNNYFSRPSQKLLQVSANSC